MGNFIVGSDKFAVHNAKAFVGTGYLKSPILFASVLPPAVVRPANVLSCPKFTLAVTPAALDEDCILIPNPVNPPVEVVKKVPPRVIAPVGLD